MGWLLQWIGGLLRKEQPVESMPMAPITQEHDNNEIKINLLGAHRVPVRQAPYGVLVQGRYNTPNGFFAPVVTYPVLTGEEADLNVPERTYEDD